MKAPLLMILLVACGGPTRQQLAETPTGTSQRRPSLAPPAGTGDEDRYEMNQSFEDQAAAQQAHREANTENAKKAPPAPLPPAVPPPPPKKGPAEQAPPPPR